MNNGTKEVHLLDEEAFEKKFRSLLSSAQEFAIATALLTVDGLKIIQPEIEKGLRRGARGGARLKWGKIIIGLDMRGTDPKALATLLRLAGKSKGALAVRVFHQESRGIFHSKMAVFQENKTWSGILGSSNLSQGGFSRNVETNVLLDNSGDCKALLKRFHRYWLNSECRDLSKETLALATELYRPVEP